MKPLDLVGAVVAPAAVIVAPIGRGSLAVAISGLGGDKPTWPGVEAFP